jgi:hypothetical protein
MIGLCLQVYFLSPGDRVLYSDQHALNLLLGSAVYREITCFAIFGGRLGVPGRPTADPNLLQKVRNCLTCLAPSFDGEFCPYGGGRDIYTRPLKIRFPVRWVHEHRTSRSRVGSALRSFGS